MKSHAVVSVLAILLSTCVASAQAILPLGAYDANQDGSIGDSHALVIIDFLNFGGTSPLHPGSSRQTYNVTGAQADYEGTTPDSSITALDALRIINFLNSTPIHTNPTLAEDVDNSGFASALDALLIINYLNRNDPAEPLITNVAEQIASGPFAVYPLTLGYSIPTSGAIFYDVDSDFEVTSSDALAVINYLNSNP